MTVVDNVAVIVRDPRDLSSSYDIAEEAFTRLYEES